MDGRRRALIVASDEFEHPGLKRLRAPAADARALARVLGDREVGGFEVSTVHNQPSHVVQGWVEDLFADGQPDDLVLLHFSGHGIKNDAGELFFATPNTRPDRLASTAVSADFVQRCIRSARAHSIVLFLDCCYGGAFGQGVTVRASGPANVLESFPAGKLGGGRGRAVITASSAMEYAFEGTLADAHQEQPSIFTSALVEGLASGEADRDEDGLISLNELYDYVFDRVREETPHQTPGRDVELQGELYLAKSRRRRVRPLPLPPDVEAALKDANMYTRLGAVSELGTRLASEDLGIALGAHEALSQVARSDIRYVSQGAAQALALANPSPSPIALDFGEVTVGSAPPTLEVALRGLPIASAATVVTDAEWLVVEPRPGGVRVSMTASDEGEYAGTLTVASPAGDVVAVPVTARVVRRSAAAPPAPEGEPRNATVEPVVAHPAPPPAATAAGPARGTAPEAAPERQPEPAPEQGSGQGRETEPDSLLETTPEPAPAGGSPQGPSEPASSELPTPQPLAEVGSTPDGGTLRLPAWCGGIGLGAGLIIALSTALHYAYDTSTWELEPKSRAALLGVAIVGVLGGIFAVWMRATREVGPGLLAGATAPAVIGAVGLVSDTGYALGDLQEGWYLALVGHLALCASGVAALVWFRKAQVAQRRTESPVTRWTLWALAASSAVSLVIMGVLAVDHGDEGFVSGLVVYGVMALVVPLALTRIRSDAGRRWALAGWALAFAGQLVSIWLVMNDSSLSTWGMPIALIATFTIAVMPFLERLRRKADV